jgi:uncharacterized membrane protein YfhO
MKEEVIMKSKKFVAGMLTVVACVALSIGLVSCGDEKSEIIKQEVYYAGVYEVGVDIPAGNFILTPDENDTTNIIGAYVGVFPDESLDVNNILYYDYFKDSYRISVTDGQFVKVLDASFKPTDK